MATNKKPTDWPSAASLNNDDRVVIVTGGNALRRLSAELFIEGVAAKIPYDESASAYGIRFDTAVSTPACTRIGNLSLHKTLPVQSLMRGCTLDDTGNVVDYLPVGDWTGSVRDGSRGQVMVELPQHYAKFVSDGTVREVWLSLLPLPGYGKIPRRYVSAYEAAVQRSANKLCSVVNADPDYRGGNNSTSYDAADFSLLGRPASSISLTNFRTYARNRGAAGLNGCGWNCYTYDVGKELFWLFAVEYATINSQAAVNAALTSDGYRQGGLGAGATNLAAGAWSSFNASCPFIPCGHTDSLGNGTGQVAYTMPSGYDSGSGLTVYANRYRGVENPFGHLFKWTDGCNIRISPDVANGGDGLSMAFVCSDPALFSSAGYTGYSHVGNIARSSGYVKELLFGVGGDILPLVVGNGASTGAYLCDYSYTSILSAETLRGLLLGGNANNGAAAGFVYAYSNHVPSNAYADIGSRLCFLPE